MCSRTTWGFSDPQIRTLWRLTQPETWNVASSEKHMRFQKSLSSFRRFSMSFANCLRFGWSSGCNAWTIWTLYTYNLRHLRTSLCTVLFGTWSSREACLVDFCGDLLNAVWTACTVSSKTDGLPLLVRFCIDPVAKKDSNHVLINLTSGAFFP